MLHFHCVVVLGPIQQTSVRTRAAFGQNLSTFGLLSLTMLPVAFGVCSLQLPFGLFLLPLLNSPEIYGKFAEWHLRCPLVSEFGCCLTLFLLPQKHCSNLEVPFHDYLV